MSEPTPPGKGWRGGAGSGFVRQRLQPLSDKVTGMLGPIETFAAHRRGRGADLPQLHGRAACGWSQVRDRQAAPRDLGLEARQAPGDELMQAAVDWAEGDAS